MKNYRQICVLASAIMIAASCDSSTSSPPIIVPSGPVPVINSMSVSPLSLTFVGGNASISADITDDIAVLSATIEINGPSGFNSIAAIQSGNTWSANISLPLNQNTNQQDEVYTIVIKASDGNGNTTTSLGSTVTVVALQRPPPPPTFP